MLTQTAANLQTWWTHQSNADLVWLSFGFAAQSMFFMRFVLQWVASERVKRSVVPETFWYFSFAGGLMLLIYAVHQAEPVFILGQLMGLGIYSRNIYLIWAHKRIAKTATTVEAVE